MLAIVSIRWILIRVWVNRNKCLLPKYVLKSMRVSFVCRVYKQSEVNTLLSKANISKVGHSFHKIGFDKSKSFGFQYKTFFKN